MSFKRNCPGSAEIAGNPPAMGSKTPGVVTKKLSVIKKVQHDIAAPIAEATGTNAPSKSIVAVESSMTPITSLAPCMPNAVFIQDMKGLLAIKPMFPVAS